ncbi:hypothetical protein K470DRAFT_270202 [Piedraia hortae CBS 480.64]|uniref:Monooxygenase n=1 Tax=Piedraia hortae CBS 480.64 TaxID=1314780 RepID=A0A6A7C160_9PEZI|nr:hypothetical protein K470DRAFT_270202 [Piedraia hortae CBS 480.64]
MSSKGQPFISLIPPRRQEKKPPSAFFGQAALHNVLRDQFSLATWLCMGAVLQGILYMTIGRLSLLPACSLLLFKTLTTAGTSLCLLRNPYMDRVILNKISTQIPDDHGQQGTKPANAELVVFLIGIQVNHPLGILAPGVKATGDYFESMTRDLDDKADEYGFMGMTSWLNGSDRESKNMLLNVCYFRSVEGLHEFAHDALHRKGWDFWNKIYKTHPHITLYHEMYHVPRGNYESIFINSRPSLSGTNFTSYTDPKTGEKMWASPVVDASKGLLRTSAGRMSRSDATENDKYGPGSYA